MSKQEEEEQQQQQQEKPQYIVEQFKVGSSIYLDSLHLRETYLRKPLGLSLKDEDLTIEKDQLHFGIFEIISSNNNNNNNNDNNNDKKEKEKNKVLVGSVTFIILSPPTETEKKLKLRQMIITELKQKQGLGTKLILDTEIILKTMGYNYIEMAARCYAKEFYKKLNYKEIGEVFNEVTIDHITMIKNL